MSREAEQIIQGWLDEISYSAATWDLDAHMRLVSRDVRVTGVPNIRAIDYRGWKHRRRNEFDKKLLRGLTYRRGKILEESPKAITFRVEETMRPDNGKRLVIDKEVTLGKEGDGMWRVQREHYHQIRQL